MKKKNKKYYISKAKLFLISKIKKFFVKNKIYLLPNLSNEKFNKNFHTNSKSYIYEKKNLTFDVIRTETSEYLTELCVIGKKYSTDKSPINIKGHRHPYTAIYDLLFNNFRNEKFNFAEIGILNNASMKMFREYFQKANLYGFEYNKSYIKSAKKDKLRNTKYFEIDVKNEDNILKTFKKIKKKFKIIIDDSTHEFYDQIKIIKNSINFLDKGGYLIIEDIFHDPKNLEQKYYQILCKYKKYFEKIFFIECNHVNKYSPDWDNDKLLILKRK